MKKTKKDSFMELAYKLSQNSDCDRARVGCVIVKDNKVIGMGWNHAGGDQPSCNQVGHLLVDNHCIRTIHAEQMAVAECARNGRQVNGSEVYITHTPCQYCAKSLYACNVKIVYVDKRL